MPKLEIPTYMLGKTVMYRCPFTRKNGEPCTWGHEQEVMTKLHIQHMHADQIRQARAPDVPLLSADGQMITAMPPTPEEADKPTLSGGEE